MNTEQKIKELLEKEQKKSMPSNTKEGISEMKKLCKEIAKRLVK